MADDTSKGLKPDGSDSFALGMDSYSQPDSLQNGEYEAGLNVICRGGIVQTRPGSSALFDLPAGKVQGCTFWTSQSGTPYLVVAVAGVVYRSASPFKTFKAIPNIQFSPFSPFISWASCVQSTYFDNSGEMQWLDKPKEILIMQDGNTRAAYWDGSASGHINPTPHTGDVTTADTDGTVIGLWMAWSNNRLWVTRGSLLFASDIGNPLKFTETQYLNEGRAFYLPGECTGIIETPDQQGLIAFTANNASYIQSSIQDRSIWLTTPGFQRPILPNIGCIAPRSIVHQYGLIWWYTPKGLISLDAAAQSYVTSRLDVQDNEMFQSKFNLSTDLSKVCGAYLENFLFHAVPWGETKNSRVHVLDQAPFENSKNAWAGFWEAWRPVEFARGVIKAQERVFCVSEDYDGVSRMWELFRPEKTDNGIPITCYVITRRHAFDDRDWKRFVYAEIEMRNINGNVAIMVSAGGVKGGFQPIMTKDVASVHGQVYAATDYGFGKEVINGTRPQSRILRTTEGSEPSACNSACVETDKRGLIDKAFSLMIAWSGEAGVAAYRLFVRFEPQAIQGICEEDETGENRLLTPDGCGALDTLSTLTPFTTYTSTQSFTGTDPDTAQDITVTITSESLISQTDADRKALRTAEWYVQKQTGEIVYGELVI